MSKIIKLCPNGYDPGTWGEAKQLYAEGWIAETEMFLDRPLTESELEALNEMIDLLLNWVCRQLDIDEHELPQGK